MSLCLSNCRLIQPAGDQLFFLALLGVNRESRRRCGNVEIAPFAISKRCGWRWKDVRARFPSRSCEPSVFHDHPQRGISTALMPYCHSPLPPLDDSLSAWCARVAFARNLPTDSATEPKNNRGAKEPVWADEFEQLTLLPLSECRPAALRGLDDRPSSGRAQFSLLSSRCGR